jgi:hypothetical protein
VTARAAPPEAGRYINPEYGYTITIPPGLTYAASAPPAPQHGIAIALHAGVNIWVDGSYDASFLGSATAALSQVLENANISIKPPVRHRKLAGLTAAKTSYLKSGKYRLELSFSAHAGPRSRSCIRWRLTRTKCTQKRMSKSSGKFYGALL